MKKSNQEKRDLLYIFLNESEQYVLTHGIEFKEFARSLSDSLNHLLLIKHAYESGEFNRHTLLEYVPKEKLHRLMGEDVHGYGDFCWVDFEELEGVNALSGEEIAELLYMGHMKEQLKQPFNRHLRNRYGYFAHDDGWWNKVYYRTLTDFYRLLSDLVPEKLNEFKPEKGILGLKKKRDYPPMDIELSLSLKPLMKEGILLSFKDAVQSRTKIEVPIWVIGDYMNMDDMFEEYEKLSKTKFDATLTFDKKTKQWQ
ncbi:Uncharacterised protein [Mycobacteroides abscessus subsp. abscessus]|nr:Uncharacterised protein [Mycobacteroides abscessus subsp. abscessus]